MSENLFNLFCYLLPVVIGFLLPFVFAIVGRKVIKILLSALVFLAGIFIILIVVWAFSAHRFDTLLKVYFFVFCYCAFISGLFYLFTYFHISPLVCQIIVAIIIILMVSSIFYFEPVVNTLLVKRAPPQTISWIVNLAHDINPYIIIRASIFKINVQRDTILYPHFLLTTASSWYPPPWYKVPIYYLIFSTIVAGLHLITLIITNLCKRYKK